MYDIIAFARCSQNDPWSLHGLWPNYDDDSWPSYCNETDCVFSDALKDSVLPLYPPCWDTDSLMCHEWEKHGTCDYMTDLLLTPEEYFNYTIFVYNEYRESIPTNISDLNYYLSI